MKVLGKCSTSTLGTVSVQSAPFWIADVPADHTVTRAEGYENAYTLTQGSTSSAPSFRYVGPGDDMTDNQLGVSLESSIQISLETNYTSTPTTVGLILFEPTTSAQHMSFKPLPTGLNTITFEFNQVTRGLYQVLLSGVPVNESMTVVGELTTTLSSQ